MKMLELRFKNLNSLYGEWGIDFTDPEYVFNGIFALTGPTGAGKSTILDAICLALYGATPRLGKITKSGNEIMSRQTGECFAEVVFESQAGRFRCHWAQHRARKNAEGELQNPRHEISEATPDGKVIENQLRRVQSAVEEKTGMDFDRFTRSILLAQGGFDTFLKADAEQKSKILEQITGTEIYSEISRRVHERQRDEREKLNLLQAETSGIVILEPEQEKEIELDLQTKQKKESGVSGKSAETKKAIDWLKSIDGLEKEISDLSEEKAMLQVDLEAFKPEREKLEWAIKAASLAEPFATLTATRKHQSEDQASLNAKETALPDLEFSASEKAESLKSAEQQTLAAKEALKTAAPLIQKVHLLDQKLTEQKKTILESEEICKKDAERINADNLTKRKGLEKRTETQKSLECAEGYLKEHERDEWLISGLTGIEEQLSNLLSRQKEITQKETDSRKADRVLARAIKKLSECTKQRDARQQKFEDASAELEQGKDDLRVLLGDRQLREYRTEKETLLREKAFLSTIAELEDHRAQLEDGKPCPLCGADKHPFAEGNVPKPDATEKKIQVLTKLINKAEYQETTIKKLEEAVAAAHYDLTEIDKLETTAASDKKAAEKTLTELKDGLVKLRAGYTELKQAVYANLQPLGIADIQDDEVPSLLKSLKNRLKAWQVQVNKKADIDKQITDLDSEIKGLDAVIKTQSDALTEKRERLETCKKEHTTGGDERKKLYGDKKPDDEKSRLNKAVADAEEAEKKARTLNSELLQKLTTAMTHVESLKKRIDRREPELKKAEDDFTGALAPVGFSEEKQFIKARLTTEQRDALAAKAKNLDDNQTGLGARQKDRKTRLTTEKARKVTDKTLVALEPQFKEYEESLKVLRDAIAGLKHSLSENRDAKERIREKKTAIESQKKECHRWEKLHGLIGSADGKKYRNFAQGLTFELMVSHANRQLEKMTDRYLLTRDTDQPLELNVVDNYQAGEIRSTRNLSGGESFIVSLTLALGLSKMASRKVRVDSLFLDEGFGTLDEDALETALETLSGLQQDGKLIGIISHVSALKERISTQINISPVSGGRSLLAGPGCNKVVN